MTAYSQHRFRALDGWRGICALLVALHHFPSEGLIYRATLVRNAWLFVDFFFVLSGFVIAHAYGTRLSTGSEIRSFTIRRFFRLWPLHVAVLAGFIALELIRYTATGTGFTGERTPFAILTNLFLVQSLGIHDRLTWNTPAWSISTEFWTYLIFGAICFLARGARVIVSAVAIAGSLAALIFVSRYGMRETFDWGLARCLYGFLLGSLAYEAWSRGFFAKLAGTSSEYAVVTVALMFLLLVPGYLSFEYLATPVFALLVIVFASEAGTLSCGMHRRAVNALGRWSYSLYMVHMLVLAIMASWIDLRAFTGWQADALTLVYLAAVIALSAATWRFIELPGQKIGSRPSRSSSSVTAEHAGAG